MLFLVACTQALFLTRTPPLLCAMLCYLDQVLAYTLVMIFDIGGALFGLGSLAGLLENGKMAGATAAYLAAAAGSAIGAITGESQI